MYIFETSTPQDSF